MLHVKCTQWKKISNNKWNLLFWQKENNRAALRGRCWGMSHALTSWGTVLEHGQACVNQITGDSLSCIIRGAEQGQGCSLLPLYEDMPRPEMPAKLWCSCSLYSFYKVSEKFLMSLNVWKWSFSPIKEVVSNCSLLVLTDWPQPLT